MYYAGSTSPAALEVLHGTSPVRQLMLAVTDRWYWSALVLGGIAAPLILYGIGLGLFRILRWVARGFMVE
jgi:hypothetical protein